MIITNPLDTDVYKFYMQQVIFHQFPVMVNVQYDFKLRNHPKGTLVPLEETINKEVEHLCKVKFARKDIDILRKLGVFKEDYLGELKNFHLCTEDINISVKKGELDIKIIGDWFDTILFETPTLSIVSESYMDTKIEKFGDSLYNTMVSNLNDKIDYLNSYTKKLVKPLNLADFGSRRRAKKRWHGYILKKLRDELVNVNFGTSNVMFGDNLGIPIIGTQAHEFFQGCQALTTLRNSTKYALQKWMDEYRGKLGIALTDTVGMDAFLEDFDLYFAKLYDGGRQDSGVPYEWSNKFINHLNYLGIDPRTKKGVYSDGLNFERMIGIDRVYNDKINTAFGIGTYITNDVGITPLQIVIKMVRCNGQPVAKISDSPGKQMCKDKRYLNLVRNTFNIKRELE